MPRAEKYTPAFKARVVQDILHRVRIPEDMRTRYGVSSLEVAAWMLELSAHVLEVFDEEEFLSHEMLRSLEEHGIGETLLSKEERDCLLDNLDFPSH